MFYRILTAAAVLATSTAYADSELETPVFSEMSRAEFVTAYEEFGEAVWQKSVLLYARMDPDLVEKVPGENWTDEDREIAGCVYDTLDKQGSLETLDTFAEASVEAAIMIEDNESLTIATLPENEELIDKMAPQDAMMNVLDRCGSMELTAKRMREMGTMAAMMEAMQGAKKDE